MRHISAQGCVAFPLPQNGIYGMHSCVVRIEPKHAVAALRAALNLTQQQMASLAGVSKPTIQAIELGKLKLSGRVAAQISNETGAAVAWLMRGEPTQPIDTEGKPVTLDGY